jgi:hypothetical protein
VISSIPYGDGDDGENFVRLLFPFFFLLFPFFVLFGNVSSLLVLLSPFVLFFPLSPLFPLFRKASTYPWTDLRKVREKRRECHKRTMKKYLFFPFSNVREQGEAFPQRS